MAFCASVHNKGAVVAVICVVLIVCWVGKPAQGSPSCAMHRCIAECPSKCDEKAASTCESAKGADASKCRNSCVPGCNHSCPSCNCDNECDHYCKTTPGPTYNACNATVFQSCKDSCEKGCKGEKVNN